MIYYVSAIFLIWIALATFFVLSKYSNLEIFCALGWHKCPNILYGDDDDIKGKCPRCGKTVNQDAGGQWK